jgi:hypothetical protein
MQRILHNETAYQVERRLHWKGLAMSVLPVRVGDGPREASAETRESVDRHPTRWPPPTGGRPASPGHPGTWAKRRANRWFSL